jgi:hypothetical protein
MVEQHAGRDWEMRRPRRVDIPERSVVMYPRDGRRQRYDMRTKTWSISGPFCEIGESGNCDCQDGCDYLLNPYMTTFEIGNGFTVLLPTVWLQETGSVGLPASGAPAVPHTPSHVRGLMYPDRSDFLVLLGYAVDVVRYETGQEASQLEAAESRLWPSRSFSRSTLLRHLTAHEIA